MESGTQENVGGMPAGPEPYNPSGQTMPTDGGNLGTSASPAPTEVSSPGSDDYVMQPNVSNSSEEQVGRILGGPGPRLDQFTSMPTPDN
jgi:hypothetical protein